MFRSATFKLTMYYLLIITVISVGFSFAVYQIGANDLAVGLRHQTQRITTNFPVFSGSPYLRADHELRDGDRRLLGRLVLLNIVVLSIAGWASYALARRTLQPIEAAHERQKRFTADVSHELRTPLTALQMESEVALLDQASTVTDLRAALTSNVEEAQKLTNLVGSLLRLSQLDADSPQSHTIVSLEQVTKQAVAQVKPQASAAKVTLILKTTPANTYGDTDSLVQLLVILLDNAVKYSPAGKTVEMGMHTTNEYTEITVTDHGAGIAKTDLDHVFERFYRADDARSQQPAGGYGLGLSIASMIAASHHATLSLTSQLHKGTTACVRLPLAELLQPGTGDQTGGHRQHN